MDSNIKILYAMVVDTSDIAIITIKNVDFCCIIHKITKSEVFDLLKIIFLKIVDMYKKILY